MENPVSFELRVAAHQQQVARINAEDWKQQTATGPLGCLRTTFAALRTLLSGRPSQATRPIGGAVAQRPS
jgi:hypothetical protein